MIYQQLLHVAGWVVPHTCWRWRLLLDRLACWGSLSWWRFRLSVCYKYTLYCAHCFLSFGYICHSLWL